MTRCPSCGEDNPVRFRFCGACGTALPEAAPAREVRKTVSVLFSDLAGSTGLGERLDPEAMRQIMSRYYERMRDVIERHGGTVEKFIGDAVMAVFGVPVVHEDDALRAVRAAIGMRDAVETLNVELEARWGVRIQTRTGVNTGEVVTGQGAGESLATGDAVNVAARLEQRAEPMQIVLGDMTYRLVRDHVVAHALDEVELRGRRAPVRVWRLDGLRDIELERRLEAPLVGRDRELGRLRQAWSDAVSDRHCELFTVLGTAGVGKSRLVREFLAGAADTADILRGRCLPYGEGITYWPLGEALRDRSGVSEADDAQHASQRLAALFEGHAEADRMHAALAGAIGLGEGGGTREDIAWAARKAIEWLAREQPLIVVFDDIHWAEPAFLDLIEHVADWSRDHPILLLCMARPELLELRPGWGGGKHHASTVLLEPLGAASTEALVDRLMDGAGLETGVRRRIVEAAEGNPLFVEEMVGMLIDDGLLRREDGRWVAAGDLAAVEVPPSVKALLAARLDRLGPDERTVAEHGSVVGRIFERRAVAALAPERLQAAVGMHLLSLVRKELVRPDDSGPAGDEAYRFRHLLIRDAAYESLPKQDRADLHERFARWLEEAVADRLTEYEEVVAYHLEQAHRARVEVGLDDHRTAALAREGGERLLRTARRAEDRGDTAAQTALLRRALAILPHEHPERGRALVDHAEALIEAARFEEALASVAEAEALAEERGDEALGAHAFMRRFYAQVVSDPRTGVDPYRPGIEAAVATLRAEGDDRGLAYALMAMAQLWFHIGSMSTALPFAEEAVEAAVRSGDPQMTARARAFLMSAAFWGSTPLPVATAMAEELLADVRGLGNRMGEAHTLAMVARMRAMAGRFDEARGMVAQARRMLEELGAAVTLFGSSHWVAWIEVFAGTPGAAEAALREADLGMERVGERSYRSTTDAELALLLAAAGQLDEAERFVELALTISGADDLASQGAGRSAKAMVLARRGRFDEARAVVAEARQLLRDSDILPQLVRQLEAEADVELLAGERERARALIDEALALLEVKEAAGWAETFRRRWERMLAA